MLPHPFGSRRRVVFVRRRRSAAIAVQTHFCFSELLPRYYVTTRLFCFDCNFCSPPRCHEYRNSERCIFEYIFSWQCARPGLFSDVIVITMDMDTRVWHGFSAKLLQFFWDIAVAFVWNNSNLIKNNLHARNNNSLWDNPYECFLLSQ